MQEKLQKKVNDLTENGYDFNFGDYISESFRILGKNIGGFVGFIFVYMIATSMVNAIPYLGILANIVVGPTLMAGTYLVANKIQKEERFEFGTFFEGFQRFGDIAIPAIFTTLIYLAAMIPFGIALYFSWDWMREMIEALFMNGGSSAPFGREIRFPFWTLVLLIPAIYLGIAYAYTILFVLFFDAKPWEAMEASRKVITKNWFIFFIFSFVIGLIAMVGIFGFFIGIIFTLPIATIAIYVSFADITDLLNEEKRDDELIDHLVP